MPRLVILESPYAGDVAANVEYARACVRDSLLRNEAPIASHLLYTQPGVLNDDIPAERQHGIDAGLAWKSVAEASVVYTDRGITKGMQYGIDAALTAGIPVEMRSIQWPTEKKSVAELRDELSSMLPDGLGASLRVVGSVNPNLCGFRVVLESLTYPLVKCFGKTEQEAYRAAIEYVSKVSV